MPNTRWYPNLRSVGQDLMQAVRRILDFIYELRDDLGPRAHYVQSTKEHVIGTTRSAVPGCSLTLTRPGKWLLTGCSTITIDGDGDELFTLSLKLNAELLLPTAQLSAADTTICTITQQWLVHISTESTAVLGLAKADGATGDSLTAWNQTTLSAVWGGSE